MDKKLSPLFVVTAAGLGMFLSTLDTGIINVALPFLANIFSVDIARMVWSITLYALILSSSIMFFGKLADRHGRVKFYRYGLILFGLASLGCALSTNAWALIIARGFQGAGAALLQATSIAIVMGCVDKESEGKMMGYFGLLIASGPTLGPALGGIILSIIGWQWIFLINIPLCIYSYWAVGRLACAEHKHDLPLNSWTIILFALAMLCLLLGMNTIENVGWNSYVAALFLVFIAAFFVVILREVFCRTSVVPRYLYKKTDFCIPIWATFIYGGCTMLVFMLPPILLKVVYHFDAWTIGIIGLVAPGVSVISARLSGNAMKRFESKHLMLLGLIFMLASLLGLLYMANSVPWQSLVPLLGLYGWGAGIFQMPSVGHIMSQAGNDVKSTSSAFLRMIQNVGISVFAMIGACLVESTSDVTGAKVIDGMHHAWMLAVSAMLLSFVLILFLTKKIKN